MGHNLPGGQGLQNAFNEVQRLCLTVWERAEGTESDPDSSTSSQTGRRETSSGQALPTGRPENELWSGYSGCAAGECAADAVIWAEQQIQ